MKMTGAVKITTLGRTVKMPGTELLLKRAMKAAKSS